MREAKRDVKIQPRGALVRGADGRLKPATAERDVADIWAEQKRIRMRKEIAEAKRRAERKAKREEWRKNLFKKKAKKVPIAASSAQPSRVIKPTVKTSDTADTKAIEISISMPKIHLPKIDWTKYQAKLKQVPRKAWVVVAVVFILGVGVYAIPALSGSGNHSAPKAAKKTTGKVASAKATGPVKAAPSFDTVLPAGKTADSLGGWSRISPPDRDPVYAFADKIGNVRIDVSEQSLPSNFKTDTDQQIANLATNFSATEKVAFGGNTAYLGTSAQGPQSIILTKNNLLILIKSVSVVSTDQWTKYLSSLQ